MHFVVALILATAVFSGCGPVRNTIPCPLTSAEMKNGWDDGKLDEAFQLACELGTTTLIVTTNGEVVRSMGDPTVPHRLHSVRKALLSALIGQHMGTGPGRIDLGSTLAELGIDDEPQPLTELQKAGKGSASDQECVRHQPLRSR